MITRQTVSGVMTAISEHMTANRDRLVELDQVNGDGDLGISMDDGYKAVVTMLSTCDIDDLGRLFLSISKTFNSAAPSSLGTITSFAFMGIAKKLKGSTEVSFEEMARAIMAGVGAIMEKAESKPGEKTILDALYPGAQALVDNASDPAHAIDEAARAAQEGSDATRTMKAVHGRAAYTSERSIGILDGGSVVGALIFKGIQDYQKQM